MNIVTRVTALRNPARACASWLGLLARDQSGATLALTAVALPVIIGMAGLGLDAAIWYMEKRQNQSVADNAVLTAVLELNADADISQADLEASVLSAAQRNGFDGSAARRIEVNAPPLSGPNAGTSGYVEVIVEEDREMLFAALVAGDGPLTIRARAVGAVTSFGEHCLVALDERADAALEFTGSSDVTLNCGIASNSISAQAILVNGSASLTADPAQAVGDILVTGSGTLDTETPPQAHSTPVPNPYAATAFPDTAGLACDYNSYAAKNETLDPGVYCGGLDMKFTVDLNPGVYVLKNGSLSVNANANVTGDEVTFMFVGDTPADVGGIANINGNADLALTAPGPDGHGIGPYEDLYAGMLFMQQPDALSTGVNQVNGGADMQFSGLLYFPNQEIRYSGGSDQTDGCIKMIARKLTFTGNAYLNADPDNCEEQGVEKLQETRVRVVE